MTQPDEATPVIMINNRMIRTILPIYFWKPGVISCPLVLTPGITNLNILKWNSDLIYITHNIHNLSE